MEEIDLWIIRNAEKMNLKISEYSWTQNFFPDLYDLSAKIVINNEFFYGRGSSHDANLATRKAVAESLERACAFFDLQRGSNGIAIHTDINEAKKSACNELIERDAFLCHFLTSTPFPKIDNVQPYLSKSESLLLKKLSYLGVNFHQNYLVNTDNHVGVITLAEGFSCPNPWGLCFGMSVDNDIKNALSKSLIECVRHVITLLKDDPIESYSEEDFNNLKSYNVEDHFKLGLNRKYADWFISEYISPVGIKEGSFKNMDITSIKFIEMKRLLSLIDAPLHCVLASSNGVQDLFFGKTRVENINFRRLQDFSNKDFNSFAEIQVRPHPMS